MTVFIDKKYINIVSSQLDKFSWKKQDLANCRCPICGDSQKNKTKTRLYFYEKKNKYLVKCHNCGYSADMFGFLQELNPSLHKEYSVELWKEKHGTKNKSRLIGESEMLSLMKKPEFKKKQNLLKPLTSVNLLPKEHPCVAFLEIRKIPKSKWKYLFYTENFGSYMRLLDPSCVNYPAGERERLVIPVFDKEGNVVGAQGRVLTMKGESNARTTLRYVTVKADKSIDRLWYGMWRANPKKRVYVVEGPIDSLFIPNSIAMVGSGAIDNIHDRFRDSDVVYVLDNEPRNTQISKYNEKLIKMGKQVCIWPSEMLDKDINDMIYSRSWNEIRRIINANTFTGLEATFKLTQWRKVI
jgi:hypothetical protein